MGMKAQGWSFRSSKNKVETQNPQTKAQLIRDYPSKKASKLNIRL